MGNSQFVGPGWDRFFDSAPEFSEVGDCGNAHPDHEAFWGVRVGKVENTVFDIDPLFATDFVRTRFEFIVPVARPCDLVAADIVLGQAVLFVQYEAVWELGYGATVEMAFGDEAARVGEGGLVEGFGVVVVF